MSPQESLTFLAFFATVFGIFYVWLTTRNKERMALIEKGADASIFQEKGTFFSMLKFGMLFVGIALGILVGNILDETTKLDDDVSYFSMIFLFGGLSLIVYHFIQKKSDKRKEKQREEEHRKELIEA